MIKWIFYLASCSLSFDLMANCIVSENYEDIAECHYSAFSVILSCKYNSAVLSYTLNISQDKGSVDTSSRDYKLDETAANLSCQQSSDSRYAPINKKYDVGHLTSIDLFDYDKSIALETNFMTNMVPQASSFNRTGAWKRTETITECYRDEEGFPPLQVYSGVIIGNDTTNDYFSISHDLPHTPDFMWKLIYSPSMEAYDAWIMLNGNTSKASTLSSSRRSLDSILNTLRNQNDTAYLPVIKKLTELRVHNPKHIELKWNSKCHQRRG